MIYIRTALFEDMELFEPGDDIIVQLPTHFTAGRIVGVAYPHPGVLEVSYVIDTSTGPMRFTWLGTEHDPHAFFVQYNRNDFYDE